MRTRREHVERSCVLTARLGVKAGCVCTVLGCMTCVLPWCMTCVLPCRPFELGSQEDPADHMMAVIQSVGLQYAGYTLMKHFIGGLVMKTVGFAACPMLRWLVCSAREDMLSCCMTAHQCQPNASSVIGNLPGALLMPCLCTVCAL